MRGLLSGAASEDADNTPIGILGIHTTSFVFGGTDGVNCQRPYDASLSTYDIAT